MPSAASKPRAESWLAENGPRELELLFRAIVYHPSAPILIADNDRHYRDASSGLRSTAGEDGLLLCAGGFAADI